MLKYSIPQILCVSRLKEESFLYDFNLTVMFFILISFKQTFCLVWDNYSKLELFISSKVSACSPITSTGIDEVKSESISDRVWQLKVSTFFWHCEQ